MKEVCEILQNGDFEEARNVLLEASGQPCGPFNTCEVLIRLLNGVKECELSHKVKNKCCNFCNEIDGALIELFPASFDSKKSGPNRDVGEAINLVHGK